MFIKIGETNEITRIESAESCIPSISQEMLDSFKKTANTLKKIAPKANDFLYFSAVMMHAAESVAINEDGTPKLNVRGEAVQVGWDKTGNTWKWQCNDPNLKPYKNSNGDIFPEEELIKAHKKWVHKPLCIDHKSSSVDHTRGFIVDTYYDRNLKRVVALCALDKANYPDLAKKVASMMQTSVSMGTAVGKAICSDCGKVAKAEQDFCNHMRQKTCYGEINIDLSPIELSIVVNGADPRAHIKHIIAAANTLNTYVDNKAQELNKIAEEFSGSIRYSSDASNQANSFNFDIKASTIEDLRSQLNRLLDKAQEFSGNLNKETGNDSVLELEADSNNTSDFGLGVPANARYASNETDSHYINELRSIAAAITNKLNLMQSNFNKLANIQEEQHMSGSNFNKRGYFQGGGGVNEPTPGQAKYTKDPLNEDMRLNGDKQMLGQSPFPGVGDVTGLHPSPESADESDELARKKMLARAEAEERAMRRNAIVNMAKKALENKKAYYQGGGGPNEPTPGKVKYPVDPLNMDARSEDKQMVGQKPFPGVGDVNALHPSPSSADEANELKRKQMLSRAGLKAKFVKAANGDGTPNLAKSGWQVFFGDRLLLTASVHELSGGNTHMMYDTIATKDFGSKLLEKVKVYGADGVRSLVKRAAGAMPPPPAPPPPPAGAMPPAPGGMPPAPGAEMPPPEGVEGEEPVDTGKKGDPAATALELAEKVRDLGSDLVEAVRALTGEKAEMGEMGDLAQFGPANDQMGAEMGMGAPGTAPGAPMAAAASFSTATLNNLRKELNGALSHAMKESIAELNDHRQELEMIANVYSRGAINKSNAEFVKAIVKDAFLEAKNAASDGLKLMTAFVKYARGTQALVKRAEMERSLRKTAMYESDEGLDMMLDDNDYSDENMAFDLLEEEMTSGPDDFSQEFEFSDEPLLADDEDYSYSEDGDEDEDDANYAISATPDEMKNMDFKPGQEYKVASKRNRAALRAKLAADAVGKMDDGELRDMSKAKFSDMLDQANKLTISQTKLDTKPSDDLGVVETLEQRNRRMMEVATAPVKVRKEAEAIARLVSEGKLDPSDLNSLVAEGLDAEAVKYYKQYYGQVEGGSEFASELVKEHVKAHVEDELNTYRVKMARAYELAHEMVDRGLCLNDRNAISSQVDEIMKFNDESFDSLKRVVAKHAPMLQKEAGRMPQVGMIGSSDVASAHSDDWSQLSAAFAKTSKRMF